MKEEREKKEEMNNNEHITLLFTVYLLDLLFTQQILVEEKE